MFGKMAMQEERTAARSGEEGYIVVETVGAFVPFVLLVISILSLVNIVALQARVHYALTQAAGTLSMYSYVLEVTGVANDLTALDNKAYRVASKANAIRDDVNALLSGMESFSGIGGAMEHGGSAVERIYSWGEEAVGDPQGTVQDLMNYGLDELRNQLFEAMVRPLVGRYLANGDISGDEYLRSARVVGSSGGNVELGGLAAMEFHKWGNLGLRNSVMIDRNGNVKLVVYYEVEYTFGGLRLPFGPTLKITQTAVTKAWLNGSGKGYW